MATAPSLFGATPESIQQARDAALNQEANAYAQLDPFQRASAGLYRGGSQLGGAIGRMLGGQDPEMQRASLLRQLGSQADSSTPEGMLAYAQALQSSGLQQEAFQASQQAQAMQLQGAKLGSEQASLIKTQAETTKLNNAAAQDTAYRDALAKLGPSPTQEQILGATVNYGSPDRVLSIVQGASDKEAVREQALALFKERQAETARLARERGQDRADQRAQTAADKRDLIMFTASLKGDKPLTEFQGKALTFGTRAATASNIISSLEGKYNTLSSAYLPAFVNSTEGQQVQQAQSNFVNAVLRQESGAAIATSEFDNAKKQYFPQYGDKPAVLAQKKANREQVIKGFSRQAGPGGKDVDEAFNTPTARIEAPAKNTTRVFASESAATAANLPRGTQITINGRKAVVE